MKNESFFKRGRICTLVLLSLLIGLTVSCNYLQKRELGQKRELWAAQKVADYRFKIKLLAFASDANKDVQIEVRGGKQVSMKCVECEVKSYEPFSKLDTIEKLFDLIEHEIDSGKNNIAVKYDETSGYPLLIDGKSKESDVTDNFWKYKISDFEIIK